MKAIKYNQNNPDKAELSDYEKNIFGRVSNYASTSPLEFVAEYIAARMNGTKFPKAVNDQYQILYGKGDVPIKLPE